MGYVSVVSVDDSGFVTKYEVLATEQEALRHNSTYGGIGVVAEPLTPVHQNVFDGEYLTFVTPSPKTEDIKKEAQRRIQDVMPSWAVERAQTGGARIPANVLAYVMAVRQTSNDLEGTLPADYANDSNWPTPPETVTYEDPPTLTRKDDVWERCTDAEAELLMTALDEAPAKLKGMWFDNPYISHSHAQFSTLRNAIIEVLGGDEIAIARADELLAKSEML